LKKKLQPHYPQVVYFPDRILVVILAAILTWRLDWDEKGLEILGPMKNTGNGVFEFKWPFQFSHMKHVRTAMSTSFIIALLGFFESSVAAKGLGESRGDGVKGMTVSPNREMVALGVANVVGGCFMALPAFGGYGRSKVNASTGARSPMSSIFLSLITLVCILVLLPYLYYLPVGSPVIDCGQL
jgi:MFS superfamily sulfate permease-like transporter